eukprot:6348306-Prymnesium_polylepis.1
MMYRFDVSFFVVYHRIEAYSTDTSHLDVCLPSPPHKPLNGEATVYRYISDTPIHRYTDTLRYIVQYRMYHHPSVRSVISLSARRRR